MRKVDLTPSIAVSWDTVFSRSGVRQLVQANSGAVRSGAPSEKGRLRYRRPRPQPEAGPVAAALLATSRRQRLLHRRSCLARKPETPIPSLSTLDMGPGQFNLMSRWQRVPGDFCSSPTEPSDGAGARSKRFNLLALNLFDLAPAHIRRLGLGDEQIAWHALLIGFFRVERTRSRIERGQRGNRGLRFRAKRLPR